MRTTFLAGPPFLSVATSFLIRALLSDYSPAMQTAYRKKASTHATEETTSYGGKNTLELAAAVSGGGIYSVGPDLSKESARIDAETFGGLPTVTPVAVKGKDYQLLLHCRQGHGALVGRTEDAGRPQFGGQMAHVDETAPAKDKGLLDDVFQLPHIARKVVIHESRHNRFRNACNILPLEAVKFGHEMVHEEGDVLTSSFQGGQLKVNHPYAVVQVFTECPGLHQVR
jgi:hypothetical protein